MTEFAADWERLTVILTRCVQGLPRDSNERTKMFQILDDFRTSVEQQRKIVLTGASGSGKTTLLNELMHMPLLPAVDCTLSGDAMTFSLTQVICDSSLRGMGVVIEVRYISVTDFVSEYNRHQLLLNAPLATDTNPQEDTAVQGQQQVQQDGSRRTATDAERFAAETFFKNIHLAFGGDAAPSEEINEDSDHLVVKFLREMRGKSEVRSLTAEQCQPTSEGSEVIFDGKDRFFSHVAQRVTVRGDFSDVIPTGTCIVDCPGADDNHPVRTYNRQLAIKNSFAMIAVANIGSAQRFNKQLTQSVLPEIEKRYWFHSFTVDSPPLFYYRQRSIICCLVC